MGLTVKLGISPLILGYFVNFYGKTAGKRLNYGIFKVLESKYGS